jgi:hypothetical protein
MSTLAISAREAPSNIKETCGRPVPSLGAHNEFFVMASTGLISDRTTVSDQLETSDECPVCSMLSYTIY